MRWMAARTSTIAPRRRLQRTAERVGLLVQAGQALVGGGDAAFGILHAAVVAISASIRRALSIRIFISAWMVRALLLGRADRVLDAAQLRLLAGFPLFGLLLLRRGVGRGVGRVRIETRVWAQPTRSPAQSRGVKRGARGPASVHPHGASTIIKSGPNCGDHAR